MEDKTQFKERSNEADSNERQSQHIKNKDAV